MQYPHVLDSNHISWSHLQPDVVLGIIHDVIKGSHGLVKLLNIVHITIKMRVPGKVGPVDPLEVTIVVMSEMLNVKYP